MLALFLLVVTEHESNSLPYHAQYDDDDDDDDNNNNNNNNSVKL